MIRIILLLVVALSWGTASILYTYENAVKYNSSQKIPDIFILHTTTEIVKEKIVIKKAPITKVAKNKIRYKPRAVNLATVDRDCMLIALWSESRNDTLKGIEAAAYTMMVRKKAYEKQTGKRTSICTLVKLPGQYHGVGRSKLYSDLVWRAKNGYSWKQRIPLNNPIKRQAYKRIELAIAKTLRGENFLQLKNLRVTHFSNESSARRLGWFKDPNMKFVGRFGYHFYFNELNLSMVKI